MKSADGPTIGFLGIHSGGRSDQAVSQSEVLAGLFSREGIDTEHVSAVRHPLPRTLHQLAALASWRHVDVVVVAVFSGRSFAMADYASLLARRLHHAKVVLFLHGGNLPVFASTHRRSVQRVFDRADLIVAPSTYLADAFADWGYDIVVIPNVVDLDRYRYVPRTHARPSLLWMRTFHEHYDPLLAVEVLARVAEAVPGATMTMGGADHGLLDATRAHAHQLGVSDQITFAGYLDAAAKVAAFARHDVFLNTNVIDNTPVSVIEAAACGLVPVATRVGGVGALLDDGVDSVLVDRSTREATADAMASAVLALLVDPERYARLSTGARAMAERSAWPAVRAAWLHHLRVLLAWTAA